MTHCQALTCPPNLGDTLSSGNLSGLLPSFWQRNGVERDILQNLKD